MAGKKFTKHNLLNLFLLKGVKGLEERHESNPIPRATFLKACETLRAEGEEKRRSTLERAMDRLAPPQPQGPGKGRKPPQVGDIRDYSTQQTNSGPFARINVESLGVGPGEKVRAVFQDNEIKLVVSPVNEEDPQEATEPQAEAQEATEAA